MISTRLSAKSLFLIVLCAVLAASAIVGAVMTLGKAAYRDDCQMAGYGDVVRFAGNYFCVIAEGGVLYGVQIGFDEPDSTTSLAGRDQ